MKGFDTKNKIKGRPVYYDPNGRTFSVTVDIGGVNRLFEAKDERLLVKKVNQAIGAPPFNAIHIEHTHWITKPEVREIEVVGNRIMLPPKQGNTKRRTAKKREYYNLTPETLYKLNTIYTAYTGLRDQFKKVLSEAGHVEVAK